MLLASSLLGVPARHQTTTYTCGPAAVQAVAAYYGFSFTEAALAFALGTEPDGGTRRSAVTRFLNRIGIPTTRRDNATLEDLRAAVSAKRPPIIVYQAWRHPDLPELPFEQMWDNGHYAVVVGIDDEYVYLVDPVLEEERAFIPRAEFLRRWHGEGHSGRREHGIALIPDAAPANPTMVSAPLTWWRVE